MGFSTPSPTKVRRASPLKSLASLGSLNSRRKWTFLDSRKSWHYSILPHKHGKNGKHAPHRAPHDTSAVCSLFPVVSRERSLMPSSSYRAPSLAGANSIHSPTLSRRPVLILPQGLLHDGFLCGSQDTRAVEGIVALARIVDGIGQPPQACPRDRLKHFAESGIGLKVSKVVLHALLI